jgi:hypothetical protein
VEEDEGNNGWVGFQGHMDCFSKFYEFLSVDKLIPTTGDQKTSLDSPSCNRVGTEGE